MDGDSRESLEAEITALWGQISAATHRFLELLARYDREGGWQHHGLADCAQWLNWQCGIGPVAAREKLRVARALEGLPKISKAMRRGELSYSKVRALTRVAKPETEDDLLNVARHGTAVHVEQLVRRYRRAQRVEAAQEAFAQHTSRAVHHWFDDDGTFVLSARLAPEVGALVHRALELAAESVFQNHSGNDSAESFSARRADALAELAEHYLASAATDDDSRQRSNADRYQVVLHVETDSAAAEIEDGPAVSEETARRIGCDASLRAMTHDTHGNPLDIGRRSRTISAAMRRALYKRDRGCRFAGCTRTRPAEGHHIVHWADGGETKLGNLVTLCGHHHRLIHEGGFGVRFADDGVLVFSAPDGSRIPPRAPLRDRFRGIIFDALPAVDTETNRSQWRGETLDYSLAIEGMMFREQVAAAP